MKRRLLLVAGLLALCMQYVQAQVENPVFSTGVGGGGDKYVQDFLVQGTRAYEWLKKHGKELKPQVDAEAYRVALSSAIQKGQIQSTHIAMKWQGVPKDAIYVKSNEITYIIRPRYSLDDPGPQIPSKIRFAAHEIFRRMGLEGDEYEVSKQIDVEAAYFESRPRAELALKGLTIECAESGKSAGVLSFKKKGGVSRNDFCFGGTETEISQQGALTVAECGDDGTRTLIFMARVSDLKSGKLKCSSKSGVIDWKNQEHVFEAITYANISPGYPYPKGSAAYLLCCVH